MTNHLEMAAQTQTLRDTGLTLPLQEFLKLGFKVLDIFHRLFSQVVSLHFPTKANWTHIRQMQCVDA